MREQSKVMLELALIFDNNYNVYDISNRLSISCYKCKRRNETKINPITKKHNSGYWRINTGYILADDFSKIEKVLFDAIKNKIGDIKNILQEGKGDAIFWLFQK